MIKRAKYFLTLLILNLWYLNAWSVDQVITLHQNTAEILKVGDNIAEVFVANPEIADVQMNSPSVIYVFGRKPGVTTLYATNDKGQTTINVEVRVEHNIKELDKIIQKIDPTIKTSAVSIPGGIVLNGLVDTPEAAKNIETAASSFLNSNEKIINNIKVTSPVQVYLRVKIAEVNRNVLNKLNINWGGAINSPSHFMFGLLTGARAPMTNGAFTGNYSSTSSTNSIGLSFNDGVTNLSNLIDALNQENLASLLAEPNLVTLSGQTASFLAGGEIPYPVPQDQNSIAIQFKKIGISLSFTPTVIGSDRINLRVNPEVSQLDYSNKLSFAAAGSKIEVPAIKTRRAETTVELASGQSLAIAGLFSKSVSNGNGGIPGLAELPIIGALFKSTSFIRDQTELVIIVTPYTVTPTSEAALALPTDTLYHATNFEMLLYNKINRDDLARREMQGDLKLIGEAGFYLD